MDAWKNRLMDMQEALDVQREMLMHERNRAQLHECLLSWILPDPDAVDSRLASVTVSGFAPVLPWPDRKREWGTAVTELANTSSATNADLSVL